MSARPPFPIFNPGIPAEGPTFHPFSRLPKELRLSIWRHVIRRQRIITDDISSPWLADPSTFLERLVDAFCGNAKILAECGSSYLVALYGHQILSKYFHVVKILDEKLSSFTAHASLADLYDIFNDDIYDRDDAQAALKKDYERWFVDPSEWLKRAEEAKFEAQDHVMNVLPAFGFWLFPLEAMKMMVNESDKPDRFVLDMSMVIPELELPVMHGS